MPLPCGACHAVVLGGTRRVVAGGGGPAQSRRAAGASAALNAANTATLIWNVDTIIRQGTLGIYDRLLLKMPIRIVLTMGVVSVIWQMVANLMTPVVLQKSANTD